MPSASEARFIAINVGVGDAFFLETPAVSLLVDGGQAAGFATRFRTITGRTEVDLVCCTHADTDHTNGLINFFRRGLYAKECWLPAKWLHILDGALAKDRDEYFNGIYNDVEKEFDLLSSEDGDFLEGLKEREARGDGDKAKVDRGEDVLAEAIEDALDTAADRDLTKDTRRWWPWRWGASSERKLDLLFDLLRVADQVRHLAIAAARMGARLRWFEFVESAGVQPTASPWPVQVINANDIRLSRRTRVGPGVILRLSQVNRESLVFLAKPDEHSAGVLFTADSGLAFSAPLAVTANLLVTAPHHGSADQENRNAYGLVTAAAGASASTLSWVRSDRATSPTSKRPCLEYVSLKPRSYCTRCRGTSPSNYQDVVFTGSPAGWKALSGIRACQC